MAGDVSGEQPLSTWGSGSAPSGASRSGEVVLRELGPWTPAVLDLLRHLERVGFAGATRVVGDGYSADGRMAVRFVPGESPHPGAWADDQVVHVGALLKELHEAAESFTPAVGAVWQRTWLHQLGNDGDLVLGHGDAAPWNIVARDGRPEVLVDWEFAGPISRLTELAYAVWLNAQLHDDDVAELQGLPDARSRARQAHAILDGYEFPSSRRGDLVERMIELAVHAARAEAVMANVHPGSTEAVDAHGYPVLWALTWRARSASWMMRHRALLTDPAC
jgi:Ser/Thr protein kinase RdoA (MazF antagonist)